MKIFFTTKLWQKKIKRKKKSPHDEVIFFCRSMLVFMFEKRNLCTCSHVWNNFTNWANIIFWYFSVLKSTKILGKHIYFLILLYKSHISAVLNLEALTRCVITQKWIFSTNIMFSGYNLYRTYKNFHLQISQTLF